MRPAWSSILLSTAAISPSSVTPLPVLSGFEGLVVKGSGGPPKPGGGLSVRRVDSPPLQAARHVQTTDIGTKAEGLGARGGPGGGGGGGVPRTAA